MLLELPGADEIDELARSTPELNVRKFEYDMKGANADLDYTPCKGRIIIVVMGEKGTVLIEPESSGKWSLPSGFINTYEKIEESVTRVAKETCGVTLRSRQLIAMFDVIRHFKGVTIKRLYIVYSAITDDSDLGGSERARFMTDIPDDLELDEMDRAAIENCEGK